MAYSVQLLERDEQFLATCSDIPDAVRSDLLERCEDGLANISDEDRCEPAGRIAADRFRYYYIFRDENGVWRTIRFFVDESPRVYNVLRVLYVDIIEGKRIGRLGPLTS